MKKPLITFDSPPDPDPTYCEAIDCEHFDLVKGCLIGRIEGLCDEEAMEKGEKENNG